MTSDQVGAVVFAAATLVLGMIAIANTVGFLVSHDFFYASIAMLATGFGLALAYETVALWTDAMPTISRITAQQFEANRATWLIVLIGVMLVTGNVVVDFRVLTRLRGWLVAGGLAGLIAGAVVAIWTNWLP
jgi:hypothetical protein